MKRLTVLLAVLLMVVLLLSGCQTLKAAFCSPSADQFVQAATSLTQATELKGFLSVLPPSPEVTAILAGVNLAIPILDRVRQNICVSAEEFQAAIEAVRSNEAFAKAKLGYKK